MDPSKTRILNGRGEKNKKRKKEKKKTKMIKGNGSLKC